MSLSPMAVMMSPTPGIFQSSQMSLDKGHFVDMPKVELHAHLSGSISRQCLHEIWLKKKSLHPDLDLEDPLTAMPSDKVDDLRTFFPLFSSYIYRLCNDHSSIEFSTRSVLDDFERDGVVYLELRTTPRAIPEANITAEEYVAIVLQCISDHMKNSECKLTTRLILSIDRRWSSLEADKVLEIAIRLQSAGVVGIDLCGDPTKGDVRTFDASFRRAKAANLKITLHFAESEASASDDEVSTLLSWDPDRLGHVIHVSDRFKDHIVEKGIGVELCLSCNVHLKMIVGSYSDHHLQWWRRHPHLIALSTDDVGVFCSPLSEEYYLAAKHFQLSKSDIRDLCAGSIKQSFATANEKQRLIDHLNAWFSTQ